MELKNVGGNGLWGRRIVVDRGVMIEGLVVFGMGMLSIVEGIRLDVIERIQMYDVLGPGNYNIGVGLLLIIVSVVYFLSFRKKRQDKGKRKDTEVQEKGYRRKMINIFVILGAYIVLIYGFGYLFATLVFFLLINRVVGFRAWLINGGISLGTSLAFYLVFVYGLDMIFPRGVLFEWLWG